MAAQGCRRCGDRVFYTRRYSGESLCQRCFSESIEEKVRRTISKYDMLGHGDRVGVAVSGGKDSLSLLNILAKSLPNHGSDITAITVDEGIDGYREESIANATEVTKRLGVKLKVVGYKQLFGFSQDEAMSRRKVKMSSCAICGTLRRRAIDIAVDGLDLDVLATAHNLDDMVQTFMINFMNGDVRRLSWLGGTPSSSHFRVRRIHPFMEIYEKEAALYAFANSLPMQSVHCPYMDEGIRSDIRVYLNGLEEQHPGIKYMMLKSALGVSSGLGAVKVETKRCSICGRPASGDPCSVCQVTSQVAATTV